MENFEEIDVPMETKGDEETEVEKEIKTNSGNKTNAVNYKTDFVELQEERIREEKKKIKEIIEKSEKIKEEADKLFNQEKKD